MIKMGGVAYTLKFNASTERDVDSLKKDREHGSYQWQLIIRGKVQRGWNQALLIGAQCQVKTQLAQKETQKFPLNIRNQFFTVWVTGTTCLVRLWSPWRYSEAIWTWSWATGSRWPCLSKGSGQDDLNLNHSMIL